MSSCNTELNFEIFDNNPVACCAVEVLTDINQKPCDWVYRYCNDAFAKIKGYDKNIIINQKATGLIPNISDTWLQALYRAAFDNKPSDINAKSDNNLKVSIMPVGKTGLCLCLIYDVQDNENDKSNDLKDKEKHVISKLSEDFASLYRIELNSGRYEILRLASYTNANKIIKDDYNRFSDFDEYVCAYADAFIEDKNKDEFLDWLSCSGMKARLMKNEKIKFNYESVSADGKKSYYEANAVKGNISGNEFNIFLGFRNIDSILYKEKEIQGRLEKALAEAKLGNEIITAIAKTYQYISRIDIRTGYYEEIANKDGLDYDKSGNAHENNKKMAEKYVAEEYKEAFLKFTDISTLAIRMKTEETIVMEYKMKDDSWHRLRYIEKSVTKKENLPM